MVTTVKFSEFVLATLTDPTNELVGLSGGANARSAKVTEWTTLTRPAPPFDGLLGYNTDLKLWEYWDAATLAWVQFAPFPALLSTFILQTPSTFLPNAQSLSALTTGILKSTTVSGVVSISAPLTSIDGLTTAADEMLYTTGANTYATTGLSAFARTLLADISASAMRSTLGLGEAAVKDVTDNTQNVVASVKGSFVAGHNLIAGDNFGTIVDSGLPPGTGTVTSVGAGTGLTATPTNPITNSGTISFASVADQTILSNISGSSGAPIPNTLSAIFDNILGSVQGDIIYRNATSWVVLSPGTAGEVLSTGGPAANPSWIPASSSSGNINPGLIDQLAYYAASGTTLSGLATANNGVLVTDSGGVPSISSTLPSGLTIPGYLPTSLATGDIFQGNGSNIASAVTLSAAIDAAIGSTQGDIIYRNATSWVVLAPGTSGQFLQTQGAAANPIWAPGDGAGTVTSITAGTGLTAISTNPITSSGTILFASVADGSVLANISGGSAAPIANTLTAIIDHVIGATQGDILYRNASSWVVLPPGTSGNVLSTGGAGANPSWIAQSTSSGTVTSVSVVTANGFKGTVATATTTPAITIQRSSLVVAYKSTSPSAITGNSTVYPIICDTKIVDTNGDFNTTTGLFTAPATGIYRVNSVFLVTGLSVSNTIFIHVLYLNGAQAQLLFYDQTVGITNGGSALGRTCTFVVSLNAGDTIIPVLNIQGSATANITYNGGINDSLFAIERLQ